MHRKVDLPRKNIEVAFLLLYRTCMRGNIFEPANKFEDIIIEEERT